MKFLEVNSASGTQFYRDMKLKDASDLAMTTSHDLYAKAQKERLENLDQANQEIDRLRKTVEKLQSDLDGSYYYY